MASASLTDRPSVARRRPQREGSAGETPRRWGGEVPAPPTVALSPGATTLADRVADVWEALAAPGAASCLICGGELRPRWSATAGVVGGRCDGCGTALE